MQQNRESLKDNSILANKDTKFNTNINSNLKNLARNKNNDNKLVKFKENITQTSSRNKVNESDFLDNSNFSSMNNSIASNSNFNFNNTNKTNKETIEKLAQDLDSDRESNKFLK